MTDLAETMLASSRSGYTSVPRYKNLDISTPRKSKALFDRATQAFRGSPRFRNVKQTPPSSRKGRDRWHSNMPIYDVTPPTIFPTPPPGIGDLQCSCSYRYLPARGWMIALWFAIIIMSVIVLGYSLVAIFGKVTPGASAPSFPIEVK